MAEPHVLYMIEHRRLGLRKIGITSTAGRVDGYRRLDYWRARYWCVVAVKTYDRAAMLRQGEALALDRLDQLGARDTDKLNELHVMLGDGRTEMYDPEVFDGDLNVLLSDELAVRLERAPIVRPERIVEPGRVRARKAWATTRANKVQHYPQLFAPETAPADAVA